MGHTIFRQSVPYNNIKLAGDVWNWSRNELTSVDRVFAYGGDVSLAEMQMASSVDVEPQDGIVASGALLQRYAIANESDDNTTEGVYAGLVSGSGGVDWVGTRDINLAGSQQNISLGSMAQWDYTAVMPGKVAIEDQSMSIYDGTDQRLQNIPVQIFSNAPLYVMDGMDSATRYNMLVRSSPLGGKFSYYRDNTRTRSSRAATFAGNEVHSPLLKELTNSPGTATQAVLGVGRSSSASSNYRVALHNVTINTNGSISIAYSTTSAGDFAFGQSNCLPCWTSYIANNTVAAYIGRGGGTHKVARITVSGTTATNTNLVSVGATTGGANAGMVCSTHENYGSTKYTFVIKADTSNGANNFVKIQCYDSTSGMTAKGSLTTLVTDTGRVKAARMCILSTTATEITFLYGYSDNLGNIKVRGVTFNVSTNSYAQQGALVTYAYGDTSLNNQWNLETLTNVSKTTIEVTGGGEWTPGGTNDFEDISYWAMSVSTNQDNDPVDTVYGNYNHDTGRVRITDSSSTNGRQTYLHVNNFMQSGSDMMSGINTRSNAGLPWRLQIGGHAPAGTNTELAVTTIGLDANWDWGNYSTSSPPGDGVFDNVNTELTSGTGQTPVLVEPGWDVEGFWRVSNGANSYPATFNVPRNYGNTTTYYLGSLSFQSVGPNMNAIYLSELDDKGENWDTFLMTDLRNHLNSGGDVGMTITTGGSLSAAFIILGNSVNVSRNFSTQVGGTNFISIDTVPVSAIGSHEGNSWSWVQHYSEGNKVYMGVTFTQL
jgi:hypothetical protein